MTFTPVEGATGANLKISKSSAQNAGAYHAQIVSPSGSNQTYVFGVEVANPFPQLFGKTGAVVRDFALTPVGKTDTVRARLSGTVAKSGAFSASVLVEGRTLRLAGKFDADWNLVLKLPKGFAETTLKLSVDWADTSVAPVVTLSTEQDGAPLSEWKLAQVGARDFHLPAIYTGAVGYLDRPLGYLKVLATNKTGQLVISGALPTGERFVGATVFHQDVDALSPETAEPVSDGVLLCSDKSQVEVHLRVGASVLGGFFAKVGSASQAPVQGYPYTFAPKGDVIQRDLFDKDAPIWMGLTKPDFSSFNLGALRVSGPKLIPFTPQNNPSNLKVSVNPAGGLFSGTASVPVSATETELRSFSGVLVQGLLIRLMDSPTFQRAFAIGVTGKGDSVVLHP